MGKRARTQETISARTAFASMRMCTQDSPCKRAWQTWKECGSSTRPKARPHCGPAYFVAMSSRRTLVWSLGATVYSMSPHTGESALQLSQTPTSLTSAIACSAAPPRCKKTSCVWSKRRASCSTRRACFSIPQRVRLCHLAAFSSIPYTVTSRTASLPWRPRVW